MKGPQKPKDDPLPAMFDPCLAKAFTELPHRVHLSTISDFGSPLGEHFDEIF